MQPLWNALDAALAHKGGALLAVSGGPDSRALLEAAARWPRRFELTLEVASVDHGTRPESHAEADAVAARARTLGFDAAVLVVDDAGRNEADWRALRYAALLEHARRRGLAAVVVAHHEGDAAENALLSLTGAGGGAFVDVVHGGVAIVRPFLALSRGALREALAACGVADDAFTDPDARSARARLRRTLLAPLAAARGDIEARLARHNADAADDDSALTAAAAALVSDDVTGVRVAPSERPALVARALKLALARAWTALPGGPPPDPRDAAAAVAAAASLIRARKAGHVDAPQADVDVDAAGAALIRPGSSHGSSPSIAARAPGQVADGPAATHDGRVRRLSVLRAVPTMVNERKDFE